MDLGTIREALELRFCSLKPTLETTLLLSRDDAIIVKALDSGGDVTHTY